MKANVSSGTKPEVLMRKALSKVGLRSYKLNCKGIIGTPDIAYPQYKISIFIHGCFWHRHVIHRIGLPKTHRDYWRRKFDFNKQRDQRKAKALRKLGWKVFVVWECQVKKNPYKYARLIRDYACKAPVQ